MREEKGDEINRIDLVVDGDDESFPLGCCVAFCVCFPALSSVGRDGKRGYALRGGKQLWTRVSIPPTFQYP